MTRQPDDIEFVVRRAGDDPFGDTQLRSTVGFSSQDLINAVAQLIGGGYVGTSSIGTGNIGGGTSALKAITSAALYNIGIGVNAAIKLQDGDENVALGKSALAENVHGIHNIAIGTSALGVYLGDENTAVGNNALLACLGVRNTGVGLVAGGGITTGTHNTCVGPGTMFLGNGTGNYNSCLGENAGHWLDGASENVLIGNESGNPGDSVTNALRSGNNNVFVGKDSGLNSPTQANDCVAVGHGAVVGNNGAIAIGSGAQAGPAGSLAMGRDSAGTPAVVTLQDHWSLGTLLTTIDVLGGLTVAGVPLASPKFAISALEVSYDQLNWTTFTQSGSRFNAFELASTTAQNNYIVYKFDRPLLAGTWTIALAYMQGTDSGIFTIQVSPDASVWTTLDSSTIDSYSASGTAQRTPIAGLTVAAGMQYVKLLMAAKNASSSNYKGRISGIYGLRTGA